MEKREPDTVVDANGVKEEVGERVRVGFDGHEDVEGVLGKAGVLLKHDVEEIGEGIGRGSRGRRDAMEEGARVGGLPDPDASKGQRASTMRVGVGAGGPRRGRRRGDKRVGQGKEISTTTMEDDA